jgi:hypothetical protein
MENDFSNSILNKYNEYVNNSGAMDINQTETSISKNEIMRSLSETEKTGKKRKKETKEVTGSGSAGGYSQPLFSGEEPEIEKIEATEATTSSSSGMYDAPGFEDVNMRGNHTKGSGRTHKKTLIPGGSFVQVKSKCKKFPYCNQGDIKSLKFFKNKRLKEAITNVSQKMNISEDIIQNIIISEYEKITNNPIK